MVTRGNLGHTLKSDINDSTPFIYTYFQRDTATLQSSGQQCHMVPDLCFRLQVRWVCWCMNRLSKIIRQPRDLNEVGGWLSIPPVTVSLPTTPSHFTSPVEEGASVGSLVLFSGIERPCVSHILRSIVRYQREPSLRAATPAQGVIELFSTGRCAKRQALWARAAT